eukprot:Skav223740  [mRNA]  locus=scaffold2572:175257:180397:+ [translate_table: standard]
MAGGSASTSAWSEHNAKAQLRAILQELHENGDIQFDEAVLAMDTSQMSSVNEVPSDHASAAELRRSLLQLQEKHATLMNAACEEIEALRQSLQQARGP